MGAINESFAHARRVDFKAVSSAALKALEFVVPQLLPGGPTSIRFARAASLMPYLSLMGEYDVGKRLLWRTGSASP